MLAESGSMGHLRIRASLSAIRLNRSVGSSFTGEKVAPLSLGVKKLPAWVIGQAGVELGEQLRLIITRVGSGEKTLECFTM